MTGQPGSGRDDRGEEPTGRGAAAGQVRGHNPEEHPQSAGAEEHGSTAASWLTGRTTGGENINLFC